MKTFEEMGVKIPEILLPKNIDTKTWSVVACDQYTQDRDYWKSCETTVGSKPSTLNIILPEVYLNDSDKEERINKIRSTMNEYLNNGVFDQPRSSFVYVERKTAYGRVRHGVVTCIDLETYEWKPFSKALIRATEATIQSRIPPRMEIRKGAALELPHIMLLVNDPNKILVEETGNKVRSTKPLYEGSLMANSGSITGWSIEGENQAYFQEALNKIYESNTQDDGSTFLFAVGDGNHSLATAKAVWDEYKKEHPEDTDSNVRYALVEIVNIYDSGLTFEPIHRVIFNIESESLIEALAKKFNGQVTTVDTKEELERIVHDSTNSFGFVYTCGNTTSYILLKTNITDLAVSKLQPELDQFLKDNPKGHICDDNGCRLVATDIDYIHGSQEVFRLGSMENNTAILLPPVAKDSFFATINGTGPLPRKSFSMGEADEKRFYLECRRLFK